MIAGSLARRYARAVLAIGLDKGDYESLGREIADLANAMTSSPELSEALTHPLFKRSQRRKVLDKVLVRLGVSKTSKNFFNLLLDRERLVAVPAISRELSAMIDDKVGRIKAVVTSAQPLSPLQLQQLKQALEKTSGKKVDLEKTEDPSLLGGVITLLGDVEYDGSLRTQLRLMRDSLTS